MPCLHCGFPDGCLAFLVARCVGVACGVCLADAAGFQGVAGRSWSLDASVWHVGFALLTLRVSRVLLGFIGSSMRRCGLWDLPCLRCGFPRCCWPLVVARCVSVACGICLADAAGFQGVAWLFLGARCVSVACGICLADAAGFQGVAWLYW